MTTNIHFHPNGTFATKFINPLIEAENAFGFKSLMVNSSNPASNSYNLIKYDLTEKNLVLLPLSFFKIIKLIWKTKPNCVISHNTRSSLLPLLAARVAKVKNVVYFNHGVSHLGHRGLTGVILKLIERLNCLLATKIITVSIDMVKELKKITNKKITFIHNGSACGIDLDIYSKKNYINNSLRKKLNINSKDIVFVYIGRPEIRKGYNFLIDLWAKNFANESNLKLILCGSSMKDLKANLNEVASNIIPLGFVDNIPEVLSNADCLVLPSLHEGLSYAVLEAMACECLVISNDIPGIRNLIKNKINGYLLNTNNENEYVKTMESIQHNDRHKELIKTALKNVKLYDRKNHIKSYIEIIKSLDTK